ncbi:hypothetical protein DFH06DRAFT_1479496 [Mycena polygramma]|nr:hypothetical protein DFH06DRAFT_1479496 [Mycena polygramma]
MSSSDTNANPFVGLFTGMMTQFLRDAATNGTFSGLTANAPATPAAPSHPTPVPTIPVPPVLAYSSTRSQPIALPAAPTGHPILPARDLSSFHTTQPMLGMAGLGLPLTGHTNNTRRRTRRRARDLSPTQISETNATRRAAAAAHLGPTGSALQLRQARSTRGAALRGPVLSEGPQTMLQRVSSVNQAGVREVKVTHLIQAYQPGQEVTYYKNYGASFGRFLKDAHMSFEYTLPESTKVITLLEMSADVMRTGPRHYTFGPTPSGPSTTMQHELLALQALVFVNVGKNRRAGSAHLRRVPEVNPTLTLKNLFSTPWKNLFAVPTLCIEDGRFLLHSIVRYAGISFLEPSLHRSLPLRHGCLTTRQHRQFTESVEMNFDDSDDSDSDTSGGVPTDAEDDDEEMPAAPTLAAAILPNSSGSNLQTLSTAAALMAAAPSAIHAGFPLTQAATSLPEVTQPIASVSHPTTVVSPPWGESTFTRAAPGSYTELFSRPDVAAAVYNAVGGIGRFDVEGVSMDDIAMQYIDRVREASANRDFTPLLAPRRRFRVLDDDNTSVGSGIERETIYLALNMYLRNAGRWCLLTDEGRLSLGISMPLRLASSISPTRLEELRVLGALVALTLISGKPPGNFSPALMQYALNGCDLESLTPDFVRVWNPNLATVAQQMQAVGPTGSLALGLEGHCMRMADRVWFFLKIYCAASCKQFVHTSLLGPDIHGHPETDVFCWGVDLPCENGFSFTEFVQSYPGGTEFFLAHAWTAHITDYHSIEPLLVISRPARSPILRQFGPSVPELDTEGLFIDFLRRVGNPCPALLEGGKPFFVPAVIAELPNNFLPPSDVLLGDDGEPISRSRSSVQFHRSYPPATGLMAQGLISFRTCSRCTRIPLSHLLDLHSTTYPTADAATFEDALDNWFLLQILNGISKVSML